MPESSLIQHLLEGMQKDAAVLAESHVLTPANYELLLKILKQPGRDQVPAPLPAYSLYEQPARSESQIRSVTPRSPTKHQIHHSPQPPRVPPRPVPQLPRESDEKNPFEDSAATDSPVKQPYRGPKPITGPKPAPTAPEKKSGGNEFGKRMGNQAAGAAAGGFGWTVGAGVARSLF